MTKDLINRIKKGRKIAPRGMELHESLPRVTDMFIKHGELLFPAEPLPPDVPKVDIIKPWKAKKKKKVKAASEKAQEIVD